MEEEAETVRRIYREFLIGRSLRQIKTGLEEDQIPTPKGNSIWRIETIHNMLQNERYRAMPCCRRPMFLSVSQEVQEEPW